MKQESILLMSQIENIANFDAIKSLIRPSFTKKSNRFLQHIFQNIHNGFEKWNQNKINILQSKTVINSNELSEKTNQLTDYIPEKIYSGIQTICKKALMFTIRFSDRTYFLHICCSNSYSKTKIYNIVRLSYIWLHFVNTFTNVNCSNTVNIFLYLTNVKKLIPQTSGSLEKQHVNSAFTTECMIHTNIVIFREEEWFRALIHESFHNLGLDFLRMGNKSISKHEKRIKELFSLNLLKLDFSETYNEMWAEILNTCFYVYENYSLGNYNTETIPILFNKFFYFMALETIFSLFQCVKVLHLNNLIYSELDKNGSNYNEKTPAFSYYVLKCILSVHLGEFFDFCVNQFCHNKSKSNKYNISFCCSDKNLEEYTNLFLHFHNSNKMLKSIQYIQNNLLKKRNTTLFKTLKMSFIQMEID